MRSSVALLALAACAGRSYGDQCADHTCGAVQLDQAARVTMSRQPLQILPTDLNQPDDGTAMTIGPCTMVALNLREPAVASAGDMRIAIGESEVDLGMGFEGGYGTPLLLWQGGEPATVTADGEFLPGFSTSLTMPTAGTITAPTTPPGGGSVVIASGDDLRFAWDTTSADQVAISFGGGATDGDARTFDCAFPAADRSGSIPAEVLAMLGTGMTTAMYPQAVTRQQVTVDDYQVEVIASRAELAPDGEQSLLTVFVSP